MTGTERTWRAIESKPTDRIPVVGGFVRQPEFIASAAGTDLVTFWNKPRQTAITAFRRLGANVIIGLILPNRESAVGAQNDISKQTRFSSPEDMLEEIARLPSPAELHRSFGFQKEYDDYCRLYRDGQSEVGDDMLWIPNTFHCVSQFQNERYFGAENYYMALALYPEEMTDGFSTFHRRSVRKCRRRTSRRFMNKHPTTRKKQP